jgi:hypothetical protein
MSGWRERWDQRQRTKARALRTKGIPVPGTGGHHSYSRRSTGRNKVGATDHPAKEWSSKGRKEEEHITGIAKRAEEDAIAEQLDDMVPDEDEIAAYEDTSNCWDDGVDALGWWDHDSYARALTITAPEPVRSEMARHYGFDLDDYTYHGSLDD